MTVAHTTDRELIAFGSDAWFARLLAIMTDEVSRAPDVLGPATFCWQQVLEDIPPDSRTVAWHLRFDRGRIAHIGWGEPIRDPDVQIALSWADARPLACMSTTDPKYRQVGQRLAESGTARVIGDWALRESVGEVFERLHNRLAAVTR